MENTPTTGNAAARFDAETVAHRPDVVDRRADSIVDARTAEGSTARFYNADGFEFTTSKSDDVSTRFEEGLDRVSVVLSPAASVELKSEIGAVSAIEETDEPRSVVVVVVEPC